MKVQIKDNRTGKIKTVAKRFADILVNLNTAEHYQEQPGYQAKVVVPEADKKTLETDETVVDNKPKRKGRPPSKEYKTKVMTAEE